MLHALSGWGLSPAPHLVDGVVVSSFAAIALILLWPMTMDRLRRWQNRRTKHQALPQPNAQAQQTQALLAEHKETLAKLN